MAPARRRCQRPSARIERAPRASRGSAPRPRVPTRRGQRQSGTPRPPPPLASGPSSCPQPRVTRRARGGGWRARGGGGGKGQAWKASTVRRRCSRASSSSCAQSDSCRRGQRHRPSARKHPPQRRRAGAAAPRGALGGASGARTFPACPSGTAASMAPTSRGGARPPRARSARADSTACRARRPTRRESQPHASHGPPVLTGHVSSLPPY